MSPRLVIGNFNVSGRSLATWLVLDAAQIAVVLERIDLRAVDAAEKLARISPTGRLPLLFLGSEAISEPLAIAEFAAEAAPRLWPEKRELRARARAVAEEALYGFPDLVTFLPIDLCARFEPPGKLLRRVERDLERLFALWRELLGHARGEGFLFGSFSIADAFMVPHASRVRSYALAAEGEVGGYVERLLALPAVERWCTWARLEVAGERIEVLARPAPAPAAVEPPRHPAAREKAAALRPPPDEPRPGPEREEAVSAPPAEKPEAPSRPRLFAPRRFPARRAGAEEAPAPPPHAPAASEEEQTPRELRERRRSPSREPPVKPIGGGILRRRSRTRPA